MSFKHGSAEKHRCAQNGPRPVGFLSRRVRTALFVHHFVYHSTILALPCTIRVGKDVSK